MSGKTLSTSTLSLRFMQNAQRAKLQKEVELEKAEVRDDAQWDVGPEVREAWGLVDESNTSITHEMSYLPFLFSDTSDIATDSLSTIPKGRRTFNNGVQEDSMEGKEGPEEQEHEQEPEPEPRAKPEAETNADKKRRSRVHPRPIPIQTFTGKLISGLPVLTKSKSAKEAIFDNSGVGTDLRAASSKISSVADKPRSTGFLKPAGVDAPPESSMSKRFDVIDGAREKKSKRNREGSDDVDTKEKKRSKKKQLT